MTTHNIVSKIIIVRYNANIYPFFPPEKDLVSQRREQMRVQHVVKYLL